jgi:hypothetical protein
MDGQETGVPGVADQIRHAGWRSKTAAHDGAEIVVTKSLTTILC